jgi:ferredoxin/flavodoxin---NADP+ reductase
MMLASRQAVVLENDQIAPGAFMLRFKRNFAFEPGQVIGIAVDRQTEPRLYSIASGNKAELLDILYTVKPGGLLTPEMARLKAGDRLFHTSPFGKFNSGKGKALWIATGTGIAPFASMAFSGLGAEKTLIYGSRDRHHLYFHSQLQEVLDRGKYFPCTSREEAPGAFHGRVSDFIRSHQGLQTDLPCYICGSAEVVVDVRDQLIALGLPFDRIFAEIFF